MPRKCESHVYVVYDTGTESMQRRLGRGTKSIRGKQSGCRSTDGTLIVGDLGKANRRAYPNSPAKPSYVLVSEFPNWPELNHTEVIDLTSRRASVKGASDGWLFEEVI